MTTMTTSRIPMIPILTMIPIPIPIPGGMKPNAGRRSASRSSGIPTSSTMTISPSSRRRRAGSSARMPPRMPSISAGRGRRPRVGRGPRPRRGLKPSGLTMPTSFGRDCSTTRPARTWTSTSTAATAPRRNPASALPSRSLTRMEWMTSSRMISVIRMRSVSRPGLRGSRCQLGPAAEAERVAFPRPSLPRPPRFSVPTTSSLWKPPRPKRRRRMSTTTMHSAPDVANASASAGPVSTTECPTTKSWTTMIWPIPTMTKRICLATTTATTTAPEMSSALRLSASRGRRGSWRVPNGGSSSSRSVSRGVGPDSGGLLSLFSWWRTFAPSVTMRSAPRTFLSVTLTERTSIRPRWRARPVRLVLQWRRSRPVAKKRRRQRGLWPVFPRWHPSSFLTFKAWTLRTPRRSRWKLSTRLFASFVLSSVMPSSRSSSAATVLMSLPVPPFATVSTRSWTRMPNGIA
mmetsp:Transcript_4899/g.10684  ORF Transcript_4899/g.10684 Transcript_4899/m.10684 type:complete len:460 (-) Transcript_4899:286-1665(-)